jgi:ubiquinone/menaquinone biosynthesis C-methylase UbiE
MTLVPTSPTARPRTKQEERLAKLHDEEIYPLVQGRLAELLLRGLQVPARASILELGCASGAATAELLARLDRGGRVVAVDASAALLDRARQRVSPGDIGQRAFFRVHQLQARLPFADNTFDTVLVNTSLAEVPDPAAFLADLARVTKTGGDLLLATPLAGTWGEVLDLLREVLTAEARREGLDALDAYAGAFPDADTVARALDEAGFSAVGCALDHWELVFRSARELFYAPVIEHGPLPRWKEIAGKGPAMHDVFFALKEAIDTYFQGRAFALSVYAGRFAAKKLAGGNA